MFVLLQKLSILAVKKDNNPVVHFAGRHLPLN